MSAAAVQEALDAIGEELGTLTQAMFHKSYLSDWPDEESTTGNLLGGLVASTTLLNRSRESPHLLLNARLTKKFCFLCS